jgi:vancomycin permeability regulator SanA
MIAITIVKIKEFLNNRVYGYVNVTYSGAFDILKITVDVFDKNYDYNIKGLMELLHQGVSTDDICRDFIQHYKSHILSLYMKKE